MYCMCVLYVFYVLHVLHIFPNSNALVNQFWPSSCNFGGSPEGAKVGHQLFLAIFNNGPTLGQCHNTTIGPTFPTGGPLLKNATRGPTWTQQTKIQWPAVGILCSPTDALLSSILSYLLYIYISSCVWFVYYRYCILYNYITCVICI